MGGTQTTDGSSTKSEMLNAKKAERSMEYAAFVEDDTKGSPRLNY